MAYYNFMENFRGKHGNYGRNSWIRATEAGYNPMQVKTAIQQQAKYNNRLVGQGLRDDYMRHVKGYAHGLSQFQGPEGNLGLKYYNQAKAAGYTPAEIPDLAGQSGMFLPDGAYNQWLKDMGQDAASLNAEMADVPDPASAVDNTAGYSAQGLASPEGMSHAMGGTGDAFGRTSKQMAPGKRKTNPSLMINPLTY